jgi:hypothetical protein
LNSEHKKYQIQTLFYHPQSDPKIPLYKLVLKMVCLTAGQKAVKKGFRLVENSVVMTVNMTVAVMVYYLVDWKVCEKVIRLSTKYYRVKNYNSEGRKNG